MTSNDSLGGEGSNVSVGYLAREVDSSYNARTNVSVGRGISWDINIHNIHKGEELFFSYVYIQKGFYKF